MDIALGIVVPAFELSTPAVYRRWDEIGEPVGDGLPRSRAAARPARVRAASQRSAAGGRVARSRNWPIGGPSWRVRWGRPVAMSGSGPALFGFFVDEDEAARTRSPTHHRECEPRQAAVPVPQGWREVPGTLAGPE